MRSSQLPYLWIIVLVVCLNAGAFGLLQASATPLDARAQNDMLTNLPDLTVNLAVYPGQVQVNQPVTIAVTIINQGTASTREFNTYLYIDPLNQPPTMSTQWTYPIPINTLFPPGWTQSWMKTNYVFTTPGLHVLYAWTDRENIVVESNETNNLARLEITVSGPPQCEVDSYENDNTCGSAPVVPTDGAHYLHTLCPIGDQDWIRVDMAQGQRYVITTENVGADGDTQLSLYDQCNHPPAAASNPALGPGAQIIWDPPAGSMAMMPLTALRSKTPSTRA